jgi:Predicted permeases
VFALLVVLVGVVAALFSMMGQGGGVMYTPLQVLWGIGFHEAATTSLFLIMVTSLSATLIFARANHVDWPLALALEAVTALGGLVGGLLSGRFSGTHLTLLFVALVAFAATFMVRDIDVDAARRREHRGRLTWHRAFGGEVYRVRMGLALPISFLAGAVSGLVGVGGGLLKVPMMVLLFGIPMSVAVGSSAFMIGVTALGGFAGHVVSGHWDWRTSLLLGVAVFVGGRIGARKSVTIDKRRLRRGFGWFLFALCAVLAFKAVVMGVR